MFDRGDETSALDDVEHALAQALEIDEVQVVVPALGLRARLRRDRRRGRRLRRARSDPRQRGLGELRLGGPWRRARRARPSIPAVRGVERLDRGGPLARGRPAAAAGLYTQIGSRPDAAYAHLRAARLLLAEDEADAAEAQVAAARNFFGSVDATARLAALEELLSSA